MSFPVEIERFTGKVPDLGSNKAAVAEGNRE